MQACAHINKVGGREGGKKIGLGKVGWPVWVVCWLVAPGPRRGKKVPDTLHIRCERETPCKTQEKQRGEPPKVQRCTPLTCAPRPHPPLSLPSIIPCCTVWHERGCYFWTYIHFAAFSFAPKFCEKFLIFFVLPSAPLFKFRFPSDWYRRDVAVISSGSF